MKIVVRLAAAIIVVALLVGGWFALRQQLDQAQWGARKLTAVDAAAAGLTAGPLPSLSHLPAGTSGQVRAYASQLQAAALHLPDPAPVPAPPVWARLLGGLQQYHQVTDNVGFVRAYAKLQLTFTRAHTVTSHESAVMQALSGTLDYPAASDLASDDPNALTPSSKAAVSGLDAAAAKIETLEAPGDPTLMQIHSQLLASRLAFQNLLSVVGTSGQDAAKQQLLNQFQAAQQAILANRISYTSVQNGRLGAQFAQASRGISPYVSKIGRIQFSQ